MGSGHNKVYRLSKKGTIDWSRIVKTRLFFANRDVFMRLMIEEIIREQRKAKLIGNEFSIRLNATSDLSPTLFQYNGMCILDIFPNVMFYDYTKVPHRFDLLQEHSNYDITWSIDGSEENKRIGLEYMERGGRCAVVFGTETLPKTWCSYEVINGDEYDMRYVDGNVIVGLKFKKTASNYVNGHFVLPRTEFIVTEESADCEW